MKILFEEFKGEISTQYQIKEKKDGFILKDRLKRIHIDKAMFEQLEQLGEKRRFTLNNKSWTTLHIYVIPGEKIFLEEKGKTILNIDACIDKKTVEDIPKELHQILKDFDSEFGQYNLEDIVAIDIANGVTVPNNLKEEKQEKLRGVYQTLVCICMSCGKTIPTNTNPEIMSFICEDCKRDRKYSPSETNVQGVTKIMLPKNVEIEDAHKVFTKAHSIRNAMFSDIIMVKSFGSEIPRLNWFQKFFRWLKRKR